MHHLLDKNKRVLSKQTPSNTTPMTASTGLKNYEGSGVSPKTKGLIVDKKHIIETVSSIEKDLLVRIDKFGKESLSAIECLQFYVKTANESALRLVSLEDPKNATEMLIKCEQLLASGRVPNYPLFKFQTFNNLAHANNVQGNVRLSLKYLLKALENASIISEEQQQMSAQPPLPIVETYMNICNAYTFLGQLDMALEYSDNAVGISQRQLNRLIEGFENPSLTAEEKATKDQLYHQYVNLHAMCFQLKGSILEKLKMFEEAIDEYREGKKVIEANYGPQHKSYVEFANLINGAKLRIKYFMHSNLPHENQQEESFRQQRSTQDIGNQQQNMQYIADKPQTLHNNIFLQEQEMMKPINQQKNKKRRLIRPSSAKQYNLGNKYKIQQYKGGGLLGNSQINNEDQSLRSSRQMQGVNTDNSQIDLQNVRIKPPLVSNATRAEKLRKMILAQQKGSGQKSRKQQLVGGIYLGSPMGSQDSQRSKSKKIRPSSAKKAIQIPRQNAFGSSNSLNQLHIPQHNALPQYNYQQYQHQQNDHHHRSSSQGNCQDCQSNIEEIRKLQLEQQKMMSIIMQQQLTQSQQQLQTLKNQSPNKSSPHHTSQQQSVQYPPPVYMPPPHGYMLPHYQYGMLPPPPVAYSHQLSQNPSMANLGLNPQHSINSQGSSPDRFHNHQQVPLNQQWVNQHPYQMPQSSGIQASYDENQMQQMRIGFPPQQQLPYPYPYPPHMGMYPPPHPMYNPYLRPPLPDVMNQNYTQGHDSQMGSTFTNLNERESQLDELSARVSHKPHHFNQQSHDSQSKEKSPNKIQEKNQMSIGLKANYNQVNQKQSMQALNEILNGKEKQKVVSKKQQEDAAITLQRFFRKQQHQKHFKLLVRKTKSREIFNRQFYNYKINTSSKPIKLQLIAALIRKLKRDPKGDIKQYPHSISFQFYDIRKKEIKTEVVYKVQNFGCDPKTMIPSHLCNRIKAVLSNLHDKSGDPKIDLEQLLTNIKKQSPSKSKLHHQIKFHEQKTQESVNTDKQQSINNKSIPKHKLNESAQSVQFIEQEIDDEIQDEYSLHNDGEGFEEQSIEDHYDDSKQSKEESYHETVKHQKTVLEDHLPERKDHQQVQITPQKKVDNSEAQYHYEDNYNSKTKVREAGHDTTKEQFQQHVELNMQKSISKKQTMKNKSDDDKSSDENYDDSFKEEIIEDELEKSALQETFKVNDEQYQKSQGKRSVRQQYEDAIIKVQSRVRTFLAVKDKNLKKGDKLSKKDKTITITMKYDSHNRVKIVLKELSDKNQKQTNSKYEILVMNLQNKKGDDVQKILLSKLPVEETLMNEFLNKNIFIQWDSDKKKMVKASLLNNNDATNIKNSLIKVQDVQLNPVLIPNNEPIVKPSEKQSQQIEAKPQEKIKGNDTVEKQQINTNNQEQSKTKNDKQKPSIPEQSDEKSIQLLTRIQARVRTKLAQKQTDIQDKDQYKMLVKSTRRLANGKLYHLFMMCKKFKSQIKTTSEPFYLITLREVGKVTEIYDLEISLDVAKKIFGKKGSDREELQRLVNFETNKDQFMKMLESLDIKEDGSFALDFQKYKVLCKTQNNDTASLIKFLDDKKIDDSSEKDQNQKVSDKDKSKDQSKSKSKDKKKKNKSKINDSLSQEVIVEADPIYEETPMKDTLNNQQTRNKTPNKFGSSIKSKQQPASSNKMSSFVAVMIIQRAVKRYLAQKAYKLLNKDNFATISGSKLELYQKGVVRLANGQLYLLYFLLINKGNPDELKLSIREAKGKENVVSLKSIKLSDFGEDNEAELSDIAPYVIDKLKEEAQIVIVEDKTQKLHKDWIKKLRKFIEENM